MGNKDCRKFGRKNFGELKSISIGNVMEIVKIGDKTWQNAVILQIHQSFSLPMFLLYGMLICDGSWVHGSLSQCGQEN